jgi:hypothetical protein
VHPGDRGGQGAAPLLALARATGLAVQPLQLGSAAQDVCDSSTPLPFVVERRGFRADRDLARNHFDCSHVLCLIR